MNPWSLEKEMCSGFMLTIIFLDVSSSLELAFALAKYITCLNIGCRTKSEGRNNFLLGWPMFLSSLVHNQGIGYEFFTHKEKGQCRCSSLM